MWQPLQHIQHSRLDVPSTLFQVAEKPRWPLYLQMGVHLEVVVPLQWQLEAPGTQGHTHHLHSSCVIVISHVQTILFS